MNHQIYTKLIYDTCMNKRSLQCNYIKNSEECIIYDFKICKKSTAHRIYIQIIKLPMYKYIMCVRTCVMYVHVFICIYLIAIIIKLSICVYVCVSTTVLYIYVFYMNLCIAQCFSGLLWCIFTSSHKNKNNDFLHHITKK